MIAIASRRAFRQHLANGKDILVLSKVYKTLTFLLLLFFFQLYGLAFHGPHSRLPAFNLTLAQN